MPTTVIRNVDWVIAWDEKAGRHVYRRGVDLAFAGSDIVFLGPGFGGPADRVIDGSGVIAMNAGGVSVRVVPSASPGFRNPREPVTSLQAGEFLCRRIEHVQK